MKDRPFVSLLIAREVRRHATRRKNVSQFSVEEYDQFVAKMRTRKVIDAVCDFLDDGELDFRNLNKILMNRWAKLREVVDEFPSVSLEHPELHYNNSPRGRGRRARRDAGPRYQTDPAFIADRDAFREEMNAGPTS